MASNPSNTSNVISSASDDSASSDSDSTDYEPELKKCKFQNGADDGEVSLVEGTEIFPIRAATSVSVVSKNAPLSYSEGDRTSIHVGETCSENSADVAIGADIFLTVGDLVEQTLQASLDRPPHPQASMAAETLLSLGLSQPNVESGRSHVPRLSATDNTRTTPSNPVAANNLPAGDFPTIAGEDVVRTNSTGLVSLGRGRRRRRGNPLGSQPTEQNANNVSASRSSNSSSEYFTDDIDPMEIPSDEYLSPPYPNTQRRRIAIVLRRDPPPSAVVQNDDDQYYHNELEVVPFLAINENPIENGSSTSGVDDEVFGSTRPPAAVDPVVPPEETDNFADNENVKSDGDSESTQHPTSDSTKGQTASSSSEISEKDKKSVCSQCQGQKAAPCFRYCLRCFKIRRTWLPSRPASRRLKSRKTQQLRNNISNSLNNSRATRSFDTSVTPGSQQAAAAASPSAATGDNNTRRPCSSTQAQRSLRSIHPVDVNELFSDHSYTNPTELPIFNPLSPNLQPENFTLMEHFVTPECNAGASSRRADTTPVTSEVNSQSQTGSSSLSQQPLQASSSSPTNTIAPALNSQCSICYVREKDAAFVHNKIAHVYCCYTCADKILKKNGKCPICRERILRVVKIISV